MASGVTVCDSVVDKFGDMKRNKKERSVMFRLSDDLKQIIIDEESQSEPKGTNCRSDYDKFVTSLPEADCRYALFDFCYQTKEGGDREKLCLIIWCPDKAIVKKKMLYASSKDALKKKLEGIAGEVQASDLDDLDWDEIIDKLSRKGKN